MYSGLLQVVNVFYVADAGFAYCPNAFKAKMESGSVFGLTAALHEKLASKLEQ
jgi:isoquinoline 1-oxidoreductase beta subunit